jgi:hypothetical protein
MISFCQVRFELEGQGPSWWEGKIKGARVTNDPPSYLVTFDDAEYTNTYSTQNIRKACGVPRIILKKIVMPMPSKVVKHAEDSLAKLDSRCSLFCLRLIKDSTGRDFVNIIGHPDDVDHLCDPHNFKFQISQLERIADLVCSSLHGNLFFPLFVGLFQLMCVFRICNSLKLASTTPSTGRSSRLRFRLV